MMSKKDFKEKKVVVFCPMEGDKLSFNNDNCVLTDKEGKIVFQSTCYTLFVLIIIGDISITSGLIKRAKKFGFAIIMLAYNFRPYCTISSFAEGNILLRQKQYEYSSLEAAKTLIHNKILNQLLVIKELRNKSTYDDFTIHLLLENITKLPYCQTIQEIMSVEGACSKVYFRCLFSRVEGIVWQGRKPRIKNDMVNALMDIGYTILFSYIDALCSLFGFDRYKGILHTQFYMRKSLVCDLVEPFRVIIDKTVKNGINLKQFQEKDFLVTNKKYILKVENNSKYTKAFSQAILEYKDEIFEYVRNFYRITMKNQLDENMPMWEYK